MRKTKIAKIERHQYAPELTKVHYSNGSSILLNSLLRYEFGIPNSIQKALSEGDFNEILRTIRQICKPVSNYKHVSISYSCDVYSTISNRIVKSNNPNYLSGLYNMGQLKLALQKIKQRTDSPNISNVKINYQFNFK